MNFDEMAYPDKFIIQETEHKGKRDVRSSTVKIPCTNEPAISIGDTFAQKTGNGPIMLKVIDYSFLKGATLGVGTRHPNILTLTVENITANQHITKSQGSTINVGSITGHQVQLGDCNSQSLNITVNELIEKVLASKDNESKTLLKKFLENPIVASIVGAGASSLLK